MGWLAIPCQIRVRVTIPLFLHYPFSAFFVWSVNNHSTVVLDIFPLHDVVTVTVAVVVIRGQSIIYLNPLRTSLYVAAPPLLLVANT
jgi:hypothetical protein